MNKKILLNVIFFFVFWLKPSTPELLAGEEGDSTPVQNVCLMDYLTEGEKLIECTGSLISPQMAVVPSQCFPKGREGILGPISLKCGSAPLYFGNSFRFKENFIVKGVRVNQEIPVTDGITAGKDFAFLLLDHEAQTPQVLQIPNPSNFLQSAFFTENPSSESDLMLRPQKECRFSSFKRSLQDQSVTLVTEDYSSGVEVRGFIHKDLNSVPTLILRFSGEKLQKAKSLPLGALFYCRNDPTEPWVLIGLSTAFGLATNRSDLSVEYLAATFSPTFRSYHKIVADQWQLPNR